jgi:hypothetical protein
MIGFLSTGDKLLAFSDTRRTTENGDLDSRTFPLSFASE